MITYRLPTTVIICQCIWPSRQRQRMLLSTLTRLRKDRHKSRVRPWGQEPNQQPTNPPQKKTKKKRMCVPHVTVATLKFNNRLPRMCVPHVTVRAPRQQELCHVRIPGRHTAHAGSDISRGLYRAVLHITPIEYANRVCQ